MASHTLDTVVRDYLIVRKDTSEHSYARMLQIAVSCLAEMSMDVRGEVKSTKLTIQDNNTVYLPKDYMDYIAIGIIVNGKVHYLGRNKKITLSFSYDDCGDENSHTGSAVNTTDSVITTYDEHHRNGEFIGRYYGVGGGNNQYGKFRIDYANMRVILDLVSSTYTEVLLEYLYDPSLVDGKHYVHSYQVPAIRAYMYWQDINMSRDHPIGEKHRAEMMWKKQKRMAKNRHKSFTLQEALESSRKFVMGAPRL